MPRVMMRNRRSIWQGLPRNNRMTENNAISLAGLMLIVLEYESNAKNESIGK